MASNDGGAAFPGECKLKLDDERRGMSLRDYFAAKAMQSWFIANDGNPDHSDWSFEIGADLAYQMADAMLRERQEGA